MPPECKRETRSKSVQFISLPEGQGSLLRNETVDLIYSTGIQLRRFVGGDKLEAAVGGVGNDEEEGNCVRQRLRIT